MKPPGNALCEASQQRQNLGADWVSHQRWQAAPAAATDHQGEMAGGVGLHPRPAGEYYRRTGETGDQVGG
ncbi:hypothetical protein AXW57_02495 [Yersinia ruckeri]|nr:hypothetical protein AXW57_02495 [Yersinia ruckeri]